MIPKLKAPFITDENIRYVVEDVINKLNECVEAINAMQKREK